MILVKIIKYPFGHPPAELIGEIEIVNDCTGDLETGNYEVTMNDRTVRVEGYQRRRGYLTLVTEALKRLSAEALP